MLSTNIHITCVGISHHTAPLDVREQLWFSAEEIQRALPLLQQRGCSEAVLFSTCNRTELYVRTEDDLLSPTELKQFLLKEKHCEGRVSESDLFSLWEGNAVRHLFRVAAGIDSLVVGDVQILMQLKEGFSLAQECGCVGTIFHRIFEFAFRVGKRVRTETAISEGSVSVSSAMVEVAEKLFANLSNHTALVVGAGETAELVATHLRSKHIGTLYITNRTHEKAEALAANVGGKVVPFEKWQDILPHCDILLTAIDAPSTILTKTHLTEYGKRTKPLVMFDLGVPRNIDPEVRSLDAVFLYDIDTLQMMVENNLSQRKSEIPKAEAIIDEELTKLSGWYSSLQVHPTITALSRFMEDIRKEEVAKHIHRFEPRDRELVELVTKRIVNKILHTPITNLKSAEKESLSAKLQKAALLHSLFGLSEEKKNDGKSE